MTKGKNSVTTTKQKIGKVTFIVEASTSPTAKDSIAQKIQKNIKRDVEKNAEKT